jgi:Putative zinc-finger
VADSRQFGSPKAPRFGDKPTGNQPEDAGQCARCEAMLADALDGALSPADQALFDTHMALCGPCSQMLADARRGAAWLEMLRDPRPEPPTELLERILAQTAGSHLSGASSIGLQQDRILTPAPAYGVAPVGYIAPGPAPFGKVLPFRTRMTSAIRSSSFGQVILQPRLAMTAAMAFFSIALTLDLTGVRLQDLRASDLRPSSLKRHFHDANASVARYYDGLRVVYELESRVHDLQSATDDTPASNQAAPASSSPSPQQTPAKSPSKSPEDPANPSPNAQPEHKQPPPNPGTSRREDPILSRRLVASTRDNSFNSTLHTRNERALA